MRSIQLWFAIVGVCASTAALAQSVNPVTLYGRIFAGIETVQANGGTTPVSSRNRVTDRQSLIGFRGTEDLGGGLKAFFQVESATAPDAGGGVFASRNSGVGLTGDWGSVLIGRWDTKRTTPAPVSCLLRKTNSGSSATVPSS